MEKAERIVLRLEYDPYMEMEKIMVCYPEEEALFGRLCCQAMWFDGNGTAWFEACDECDIEYYWKTKPLKDKVLADKCKNALEARYEQKFRVMQKIMWKSISWRN